MVSLTSPPRRELVLIWRQDCASFNTKWAISVLQCALQGMVCITIFNMQHILETMHTYTYRFKRSLSHCSALSSQTRVVWTHISCFLLFKYKWTTMQVHLNCIKLKETEFQPRFPVRKFNHIERHYIALARFCSPSISSSSQSTLWPKSSTNLQNQF